MILKNISSPISVPIISSDMETKLFTGPICPEDTLLGDGFLLECRPFRKNSVNESDLKKIREQAPAAARFGIFDAAPLNQLLYLLSEDLLNGAFLGNIGEKDLRRVAETLRKPLYLEGTCKEKEVIQREQRMPIAGHFFLSMPDEEILPILNKPYILSMNAIDRTKDNAARLKEYPPFALWCATPAEAQEAKAWLEPI